MSTGNHILNELFLLYFYFVNLFTWKENYLVSFPFLSFPVFPFLSPPQVNWELDTYGSIHLTNEHF